MKKHKKLGTKKRAAAKRRTTRRMSLEEFVDTFVEDMLREEAQQIDQRLTPANKEQMKSMAIARVDAYDVATLLDMARREQAEAGIKAEAWKPGRPVRIWNLG